MFKYTILTGNTTFDIYAYIYFYLKCFSKEFFINVIKLAKKNL